MSEEQQEKGFTVTDRRISNRATETETPKKEEATPEVKAAEEKKTKGERLRDKIFGRRKEEEGEEESASQKGEGPAPDIDFASFILSLSSSVFIHLGEVPDPISRKKEKNFPLAKQTIDILDMLKEKTQRNLTLEEENLLSNILYDLRMRYIQVIGR